MLFKGEHLNPETGLYYMRARYYDPVTGSFITKDPYEGDITEPQTANGYNYAINDPINLADPSGYDYVNVGVSGALLGSIGGSCGVLVTNNQLNFYVSGGYSTPGISPSFSYSKSDPQPGNSGSITAAASVLGIPLSYSLSGPLKDEPMPVSELDQEYGLSAPGFSVMFTKTFDPIPWRVEAGSLYIGH